MKAKPKEPCGYSRTGWAYTAPAEGDRPSGCTCKPCRKPADEAKALRKWREQCDKAMPEVRSMTRDRIAEWLARNWHWLAFAVLAALMTAGVAQWGEAGGNR